MHIATGSGSLGSSPNDGICFREWPEIGTGLAWNQENAGASPVSLTLEFIFYVPILIIWHGKNM